MPTKAMEFATGNPIEITNNVRVRFIVRGKKEGKTYQNCHFLLLQ
jgi:hypothetical protein